MIVRTEEGEKLQLITSFFLFLCQTQKMEDERERLNRRISALTEKLADAKFGNDTGAFNVRSVPNRQTDQTDTQY